jgi:hypothetical protein
MIACTGNLNETLLKYSFEFSFESVLIIEI